MKKKTIVIGGAGGLIGSSAVEYFNMHTILKIGREYFIKENVENWKRAEVVSGGNTIIHGQLIGKGFEFKYSELHPALTDIVN